MVRIILGLIFLYSISLRAQQFKADLFDVENGLQANTCYSTIQDSSGRIIVAHNKGIDYNEGIAWKKSLTIEKDVYFGGKHNIYIAKNIYFSISFRDNDSIYIYTSKDLKKWKKLTLIYKNKRHPFDFAIVSTQNDSIFITVSTLSQIDSYYYNEKKVTLKALKSEQSGSEINSLKANKNYIYYTYLGGFAYKTNIHDSFKHFKAQIDNKEIDVYDVYFNENQQPILFNSSIGFGKISNEGNLTIIHNEIKVNDKQYVLPRSFIKPYINHFFIISSGAMPFIYDTDKDEFTKISTEILSAQDAYDCFIDKEKNVWLVNQRGLLKISSFRFLTFTFGFSNYLNESATLLTSNEKEIISFGNTDINFIKNNIIQNKLININNSPISNYRYRMNDACFDNKKNIWIASSNIGILRLINNKIQYVDTSLKTTAAIHFYKNRIYASNYQDLNIFNLEGKKTDVIHLGSYIRNIETVNEKLYLVGEEVFEYDGNNFKKLVGKEKEINFYDAATFNNKLVLASRSGAFEYIDQQLSPHIFNKLFPNIHVYSLLTNGNTLYIGTNVGLIIYENGRFIKYSPQNGLLGFDVNRSALINEGEDVWIGTNLGLSKYIKKFDYKHNEKPNIQFKSVTYENDSVVAPNKDNIISISGNFLNINVITANFSNDNQIKYYYKYSTNNWVEIDLNSHSFITFFNLSKGKYLFQLKAINYFNGKESIIQLPEIHVKGSFFESYWFYATLIFLLAIVMYFATNLLIHRRISYDLTIKMREKVKEIENKDNLLKNVWKTIPSGLIIIDVDGKIIDVNNAIVELSNRSKTDIVDHYFDQLANDEYNRKQIKSFFYAYFKPENEGINHIIQLEIKGQTRHLEVNFTTLYFDDGNKNFLFSINDITKTIDIQNELRKAQKSAEEAAKSKSIFLSNMSHEIRTPMNAIIGLTDLMIQQEDNFEKLEILNSIKYSADNLLVIINDILDLSKIESGTFKIKNKEFNLHKLILEINKLMLLKALKNNTALQYKIDENVPVNIISDPSRIHQILVNLLDNAIKFSPNGAVQLLVSFQENAIHFLVKDNGIGISEDQQEKIFESFIQADNSKIKNIIGTGLGLAISKKLCYLLGSSIQVSSKLGEGSSFSFKINYEKSVGTSLNQVNISPLNIKEFIKEKNILLVEDNEVNQMVIAKMFSKSAISITICNNGKEAIDLLEKKMFDLILMDVQMPIMDGITATKIIRSKAFEKEKYKKIKVIALTADVFEETRSAFFEAGVDDYIYKPVKEQQLFEKLYEHLS